MAVGCHCFLDYLAVVTCSLYLYCSYCPRDNESIMSIVLLIYVPIFAENRAFLNFGGVWCGRGRSRGRRRRSSGSLFSFSSHRV